MRVTVNMKKTAMWLLATASVWFFAGLPLQAQAQIQEGTVQNEADTAAPVLVQKKQGLVREGRNYCYYVKGQKVRRVWKKIRGRKYYFGNNGNAATGSVQIKGTYYIFNEKGQLLAPRRNAIMKVKNAYYYVKPSGTPVTGWNVVKGKLYYSYRNGKCAAGRKVGEIRFTRNGYARDDINTRLKIKSMEVINKVTTPSASTNTKQRQCWYYLNTIRFQSNKFPITSQKNWPKYCAYDLLDTMWGNCYGFANAFAALAKELGYKPYVIELPMTHCWVLINGGYWDNMGNKMGVPNSPNRYNSDQIYKF